MYWFDENVSKSTMKHMYKLVRYKELIHMYLSNVVRLQCNSDNDDMRLTFDTIEIEKFWKF